MDSLLIFQQSHQDEDTMNNVTLTDSYFPALKDLPIKRHTIGEALAETANYRGDNEALVEINQDGRVGRRWTYKQLYEDSLRCAFALASRFKKGAHIVIWSPNSPEWVLMEYAAAMAGLVLVTANPALQEKELRYILEQSDAVGLFLVSEFRGNPMSEIAKDATSGNDAIREIVYMTDHTALFYNPTANSSLPNIKPDHAAQIQYTSGTTGFPKGAVLSHLGLINNANFYAKRCGVKETSSWINIMPMFHTSGCGMVTLGCLNSSCRMILTSIFDAKVIVSLIKDFTVDIILGVPTMILALLEEQEANPTDTKSLKIISCGGANVAPEMVIRVKESFDCKFSTLYGQTEYSPVITQHYLTDTIDDICTTIGQPISQTDVSIQSVKKNIILPVETIGEICARGPSIMHEYYKNPDATAKTIDRDGWLHTGDLGKINARGYVTITGRVKEMIIRGGENHFPAEIENVLRQHDAISDVAVVGIPDKKWGEVIAAFVRFHDRPVSSKDLKHFCRQEMSAPKTPTLWRLVDSYPLTGSGKIKKFQLRDMELAGQTIVLL